MAADEGLGADERAERVPAAARDRGHVGGEGRVNQGQVFGRDEASHVEAESRAALPQFGHQHHLALVRQVLVHETGAEAAEQYRTLAGLSPQVRSLFVRSTTTIFLADMADFATVNGIYGRFVTDPPGWMTTATPAISFSRISIVSPGSPMTRLM